MLSRGCPLIGDKLYAKGRNMQIDMDKKIASFVSKFTRQALHATEISFFHPKDKRILKFSANKPKDFLKLEQVLFEH